MAALEIALPGATTFPLEQSFLPVAELVQTGIARNDDFFGLRQFLARAEGDDLPDQAAISRFIRHRLGRIETGMVKELPGRTRHHETMMAVTGRRLTARVRRRSRYGIDVILPNQFIGESETVSLKRERPGGGGRG